MLFSAASYVLINQQTDKVVLLPLGAIEQHGPHLAVSTDTDIVSEIALQAERQLNNDILLCPTLPFGSSHHHLSFGATISISVTTYTQMVVDLVESLLQNGFRRIVLLNGHGGNITPVKQALTILSNKYDTTLKPNIVLVTYWELAEKIFSGVSPMESPALSHACEYETSLLLHLFPEKVSVHRAQSANKAGSNGFISWENDEPYRGVTMVKQTEFISGNGSSGEPQLASAEKGKHLFDHAVGSLVQFLNSFKTWPFLESLSN
jgi:creatinine amidohydrolase